ncbi:MAG: LysM peptidoglycan-binding domain-containing protein [Erysipelotrichaceae bacterium]|nr:LysM peptidoglycan-binding domain-containing protein [Erysipelotrichaceae bacterium]
MQKIYLKKLVNLDHQLKELISISVDESIHYKVEEEGMRAVGAIIINGEYKDGETKKEFQESIDLDILATFDKILDKREFHVKVEDFDYNINDGDLAMMIQANIYGVKDDNDRMIETHEENDDEVVKEIESLLNNEELLDQSINQNNYKENIIETKEVDDNEDEDIGAYYLYVIGDNDTYSTIAQHYQISEEILKNYNHQKSLVAGQIIIIPYVA